MGLILWDFDGTLAIRPGLWSAAMVDVIDRHDPGHALSADDFRPSLSSGFPWHDPDASHHHLSEPEAWWDHLNGLIDAGYRNAGYSDQQAATFTAHFRDVFLDVDAWRVYEDVIPALTALTHARWRHVIVSNHVPELPDLVAALGLATYFERIVCSAHVGYEKPHPAIFQTAIEDANADRIAMVGDNRRADVAGAAAVGIQGFLVRRTDHPDALTDLHELTAALLAKHP